MQQLCFFLQNAVICGMFSSWNQIMPFLLAHLNSPPPPPIFEHWPTNKKPSPAQKKTTAMPLTSDPSRLRVTSCQKANKSSSCTERRRIKRPTSDTNDTGFSQGSTWGQGESRESVKQSQDFRNGWKGAQFLSIPIWLAFQKDTALSLESVQGPISEWGSELQMVKDKPYKDLVEFPVNLDVYNYISMALWPSCTTLDVRNAGNSSWWVIGPLS